MNLSRCIIQRSTSTAMIYREMRSLPDVMVAAGEEIIWDGRYTIVNGRENAIRISACGDDGLSVLQSAGLENIHRASVKSSPALWLQDVIIGIPAIKDHAKVPAGIQVTRHVALFDHILSEYEQVLAASVAKLFGLQGYKRFPVNQIHKN